MLLVENNLFFILRILFEGKLHELHALAFERISVFC